MQSKVETFQSRINRIFVLNFQWPTIVENEEIYAKTKLEPLSTIIEKRHLEWFVKIAWLNPFSPALSVLPYDIDVTSAYSYSIYLQHRKLFSSIKYINILG